MAKAAGYEAQLEAKRPMKYFSHDSDASKDIKCRRLIRRLGMEGYGRWWLLCELLASEDGHRFFLECDEDWEILGDALMFDCLEDAVVFIEVLKSCGLLQEKDGFVFSERMDSNALYFGKKRAAGRKGGTNRGGK